MVSSERQARSAVRARKNARKAHIAIVNARRAQRSNQPQPQPQPHSSQPRNEAHRANQVVVPADRVPDEEFNPLPHGQMVRTGIVRCQGIDPDWPIHLVLFYQCWWMVSFHQISGCHLNLEFRFVISTGGQPVDQQEPPVLDVWSIFGGI